MSYLGIPINEVFRVSKDFENREAIVVNQTNDSTHVVVRMYRFQGSGKHDDINTFNVDVHFWGRQAENALERLQPGSACLVSGDLIQETSQADNGNVYQNNKIFNASWRFLPEGNYVEAQQQQSGPSRQFSQRAPQQSAQQTTQQPAQQSASQNVGGDGSPQRQPASQLPQPQKPPRP